MRNQILQGDVIDIIKKILVKSINCVVTSPPYYGLRNYDLPPTNWAEVSYAPMPGLPPLIIPPTISCLGLEDSIEAYVGHIVLVFRELWRVLRDDGALWLVIGDSYANVGKWGGSTGGKHANGLYGDSGIGRGKKDYGDLKNKDLIGIPWRVAFALQADGWYLRNDIIWHKPSAMPESVTDRCTKAHEYIFMLTKKVRYWFDQEAIREECVDDEYRTKGKVRKSRYIVPMPKGNDNRLSMDLHNQPGARLTRNKRTVWTVATQPYKGAHFATFPPALIEPCILAGCPYQVCVECGEPWVRMVERRKADVTRPRPFSQEGNGDRNDTLRIYEEHISATIGFAPTCQCNAPHRPGVILDPFFGAGTVGVVARQLKRDWVGIELNADYIEMARERLDRTQPALFPR